MKLAPFTFGDQPPAPGRYLVVTRCAARQCVDFLEPSVVYFDGAKWHVGGVIGWQGPIPVMRVADFHHEELKHLGSRPPLEYDL